MIIHCDRHPRRHPAALAVAHVGFLPGKRYRVRHGFRSCNFSFILAGRGTFLWQGRQHPVSAPCVLAQWPGLECDYGPQGAWDEIFLIYPAAAQGELERVGFLDRQRPFWHLGANALHPQVAELRQLAMQQPPPVDRLDRVCERLVLESLLAAQPAGQPADAVALVRARIEADPLAEHDVESLARAEGLSLPHFRRLWLRALGCPPARYQARLRMAAACRLLATSEDTVEAVARAVGFPDPLHFSRRFRALVGEAPTAYRRRYRSP
jgi:AraC-like DNA-binding protein